MESYNGQVDSHQCSTTTSVFVSVACFVLFLFLPLSLCLSLAAARRTMEPVVIDWKNIDSRFVRDDLLEDINAPQWVDFSAPDHLLPDDACFCRPDCRHPKTPEDFKAPNMAAAPCNFLITSPSNSSRISPTLCSCAFCQNLEQQRHKSASSSHLLELESRAVKDGTLKRRAGLTAAISSLGHHRTKSCRKFGDDNDENDNPNSPSPMSAARLLKYSVKSSAERKPKKKTPSQPQADSGQNTINPPDRFAPPSGIEEANEDRAALGAGAAKLRNTVSARNLLGGGREIVNQVAEFWAELKRMALSSTAEKEKKMVEKEPLIALTAEKAQERGTDKDKVPPLDDDPFTPPTSSRQINRQRKVAAVIKGDEENNLLPNMNMMSSKGGNGKLVCRGLSQVRSCPPTPQRFPSPSNRFKHPKPAKAPSSLQSKSKPTVRGVLQEVVVVHEPDLTESTNENGDGNSDAVEAVANDGREEEARRPLDVLWFLKPCSYLVR